MSNFSMASFANRLKISGLSEEGKPGFSARLLRIEVLAGLTVALALVPEAVAFAFVAKVPPFCLLYTSPSPRDRG